MKRKVLNDGMGSKGMKDRRKTFLGITDIYFIIKCTYSYILSRYTETLVGVISRIFM